MLHEFIFLKETSTKVDWLIIYFENALGLKSVEYFHFDRSFPFFLGTHKRFTLLFTLLNTIFRFTSNKGSKFHFALQMFFLSKVLRSLWNEYFSKFVSKDLRNLWIQYFYKDFVFVLSLFVDGRKERNSDNKVTEIANFSAKFLLDLIYSD